MSTLDEMIRAAATAILARRGFAFYDDPMEGGQDAYDITIEAIDDAKAALIEAFRYALEMAQKTNRNDGLPCLEDELQEVIEKLEKA